MVRIHISLPEKVLHTLDTRCGQYGYNRAEYIRSLIREDLEGFSPEVIDKVVKDKKDFPKKGTSPKKIEIPKKLIEKKNIQTCKHGYMLGLCKYGCT